MSEVDIDHLPDRIGGLYAGKTLFITGGTGFLGKVVIEKLLRKCPDIKKIILLVRPKRGKEPRDRLAEIFSGPLFDRVKSIRGGTEELSKKLDLVAGDCSLPDLGLSADDRNLLIETVDFIIHAAATIRFDEELRKAVLLNTRGTKLMLELAKECKKLQLYVHVSTSYCHLHEKLLEERPYPPPADPLAIIHCMEWMDDETVVALTPHLLKKLPNSYAFTKALSEGLVVDAMPQLPILILRPSIVIPIWQEPIPGWTDNINGPTGLLIGAGKGVIRTMYCQSNGYADFLPVDIFVNGLMVTMWNYIVNGDKEKTVYNFTSSAEVKVSWSEMIETGREIIMNRVPLNGVAWYPGGSMKHSRLQHNICVFLFHLLPAMFVDTLLYCIGYEPVLMRVQRRINKGFEVFEYYANNQWDFQSDHVQDCRTRMNKRERRDYKIDADGLDISKYFEDCIKAARIYILKETEDTIPAARRHMFVMWVVDRIVRVLFWSLTLYWLSGYFVSLYHYLATPTATALPVRDL